MKWPVREVGSRWASARGVPIVVGLAALLLLLLIGGQLLKETRRASGASGARPSVFVADLPARGGVICQDHVALSPAAGSIELLMGTFGSPGPALVVLLRDPESGRLYARGSKASGWSEGTVSIPLDWARPGSDLIDAELCLQSRGGARLTVAGEPIGVAATVGSNSADGRLSVVARERDPSSLAESLPVLADRIGRGNASWIGQWTVWVIGLLLVVGCCLGAMAIVWTPAVVTTALVPRQVKALAAASLVLGLAWALLTPPFQVPDETSHLAYVQYLSETGRLPIERAGVAPYSDEERELLGALDFARVIGRPLETVIKTKAEEAALRLLLREDLPLGGGNATTASANPPLYYSLQAPVYLATSNGSLLTQLLAMRVMGVLLLAGSVLFAMLFVKELLPASPWTWTAAGLACAFQPVLAFIGSGVNPDGLLFLSATALFFGVARVLRCGLTTRRAGFVGLSLAAGMLTKPLFLALVPLAIAGIGLGAARRASGWLKATSIGVAVAFIPLLAVAVIGATVFDHPYFATAAAVANTQTATAPNGASLEKQASFVLQLFLPRLPFLNDQIPGVPVVDIWINGLVGSFGWVDYGFGTGAKTTGARLFLALLGLMVVAAIRFRGAIRERWRLAVCCAIGLVFVPTVVGVVDYQAFTSGSARFQQARYLLPLLALYGGLFGLAAKALGARVGTLILPALWVLVSFHSIAAVFLTIDRYYL